MASRIRPVIVGGVILLGFVPLALIAGSAMTALERSMTGHPSEPEQPAVPLADDDLATKDPRFDAGRVDRRPESNYLVNASAAVIRVDCPEPPADDRVVLFANYAEAARQAGPIMLASINMIDGKAKQFDDGLYAAIDRAYYLGQSPLGVGRPGHREILERIYEEVEPGSAAADYLAAGLSLQNKPNRPGHSKPSSRASRIAESFVASDVESKPIGFYTWTPELAETFRVLRFFARPIKDESTVLEIARVLRGNAKLRDDYRRAYSFYGRLTNPLDGMTPADFAIDPPPPVDLSRQSISLYPASTSREVELFRKLFPGGMPASTQLMRELVRAIRAGDVDLAPGRDAGWYGHQAYALEPLLLPDRGQGSDHLLLTKTYKERMLAAFQALLAKRRETHARQLKIGALAVARPLPPLITVKPRFRVEPNPAYYLRMARSYDFVIELLEASFGAEAFETLHGLRQGGERLAPLGSEVRSIRDLFLGLAYLSSEDIGHALEVSDVEAAGRGRAEAVAADWLGHLADDPDLAVDTRVAVPVAFDPRTGITRSWATIGLSLRKLDAKYVKTPKVRPADGPDDWREVTPNESAPVMHWVVVDEFAEIVTRDGKVLDRAELRALCGSGSTREQVLARIESVR